MLKCQKIRNKHIENLRLENENLQLKLEQAASNGGNVAWALIGISLGLIIYLLFK